MSGLFLGVRFWPISTLELSMAGRLVQNSKIFMKDRIRP